MIDTKLLLDFIAALPVLLVSLAFHELAHGAAAAALGDPTARLSGRLTLNPLRHLDLYGSGMLVLTFLLSQGSLVFGWAKPVPIDMRMLRHPQRDMVLVGAAGPLANLLMVAIAGGLMNITVHYSQFVTNVLSMVFVINLVLALINLIPIPPLDGSRIVGGLIPPRLYPRWLSLDRYGMFAILALLLIAQRSGVFSSILDGAVRGAARILLPGWQV